MRVGLRFWRHWVEVGVPPRCTVLVTRPEPQATQWAQALADRGQPAVSLPLLAIKTDPVLDVSVRQAWTQLPQLALVMFVSPNAVACFFSCAPVGRSWPADVKAAATGPGTVQALLRAGVPSACIWAPREDSTSFDAEALWSQTLVAVPWSGKRVLIVRGEGGRDWLAQQLRLAGAQVAFLSAYRSVPTAWSRASRLLLDAVVADPGGYVWLFSSSRAVDVLVTGLADTRALMAMRAVATHPRIAARTVSAGFRHVVPAQPRIDAVLKGAQAACAGQV